MWRSRSSANCKALSNQHSSDWEDSNARGTHYGWNGRLGRVDHTKMHTAGYRVVVTHSPGNTRAKDWLGEHSAAGRELSAYAVDVADIDSCRVCVERVTKDIGPIDILVNNAGITKDTTFKKMSKADWMRLSAPISTPSST